MKESTFFAPAAIIALLLSFAPQECHAATQATSPELPPAIRNARAAASLKPFIEQAIAADSIPDPMQRCLRFPDPPGSHWHRDTVEAYCRLHFAPAPIPDADLHRLLHARRASPLDDTLKRAYAQATATADGRNRFDRMFLDFFQKPTASMRADIDVWKRQSPRSPYAFAASGKAEIAKAGDARGDAASDKTSDKQFHAMHQILLRARADLDRAASLDPRFTTTYAEMIDAAQFESDTNYARRAATAGLAVDPANFMIHYNLMEMSAPKWGGSLEAMAQVASHATARASLNPMLRVLIPSPAAAAAGITACGCDGNQLPDLGSVFSELGQTSLLDGAGRGASRLDRPDQSIPYLLEALRFDPTSGITRAVLVSDLNALQEFPAALSQADRCVALAPKVSRCYEARGTVHLGLHQPGAAEQDWKTAMSMNPANDWTVSQLQMLLMSQHRWDDLWRLSEQQIRTRPKSPTGWIIRSAVQAYQPRPGLRDTERYLVTHFSNDPTASAAVEHARQDLALPPSPAR
ncbi:MAG: DUF4034 domain-containing protein [Proteobacteria bacterium]|nr:DUF4034 domain-containing protein [Pseudomonadota bacterium]